LPDVDVRNKVGEKIRTCGTVHKHKQIIIKNTILKTSEGLPKTGFRTYKG